MRSRGSRRSRLIALILLSSCLLAAGLALGARRAQETHAASLQRRLSQLSQRKAHARQQLSQVKQQARVVTRKLAEIDTRLDHTEARLGQARQQVRLARADLLEAARRYQEAEARLESHRESVSERLVAIYEQGDLSPMEVLLQATSFTDFANRLYLLNQVVECDAELLEDYDQARAEAERRRGEMAERERQLTQVQMQWSEERARVARWRDQTAERKRRLLASQVEWERALAEMEQDSREIGAMLQRLQRTRAGQQRYVKPWQGNLAMPVSGRITSGYGYRTHPIFRVRRMHTGVDIAAPAGTAIHAAAGGTVVFSGRWGGYGNCVIIDHGGGMATLYGHCSSLLVQEGQVVRQGQTIATVGSTGLATGPHLHFEKRINGQPVNPL